MVLRVTELVRTAEVLNIGKKIVILVGVGERGATQDIIIDVAEILGA
ncbi:hypothetical protein [Sodalis-like endosymbiont of Proechinophthirus fluctus]